MKAIILSIILSSLELVAAQAPHQLIINNYSEQSVTVYYQNILQRYVQIEALKKNLKIPLSSLPQNITVHFDHLNVQQDIRVNDVKHPLTILQQNTINIKRNGESISPAIHFSSHNPSSSVYQDN